MADSPIGYAPLERILTIQDAICVVEIGGCNGTGVLIGPDVALTNYHVAVDFIEGRVASAAASCRFDYHSIADQGWTTPIIECLAHAPPSPHDWTQNIDRVAAEELDYAVLRIASHPKLRSSRRRPRRWIAIPDAPREINLNADILVAQHPMSLDRDGPTSAPLCESPGHVTRLTDYRLLHTAETLRGSSGAACFNRRGEFIALHQAGDPRGAVVNAGTQQAIPIARIRGDILAHWPTAASRSLGGPPPAVAASDVSNEEIVHARVKAARIMMDRTLVEQSFRKRRSNGASPQRNDTPLVHFFICRKGAEPEWLIDRLAKLTLCIAANDEADAARLELLRKEGSENWTVLRKQWFSPTDGDDETRLDALDIGDFRADAKRFYLFAADMVAEFEPARERSLIEAFALKCAQTPQVEASRFQAAVVFRASNSEAEAKFASFANLWARGKAPAHCGLCETLGDIGADDLLDWQDLLTRAWTLDPDHLRRDVEKQFLTSTKHPLGAVAENLRGALENYVKSFLVRSG